jgi:hypothetical protein
MELALNLGIRALLAGVTASLLVAATDVAAQQPASAGVEAAQDTGGGTASQVWIVAGAAFSTLRGDCQTCEGDYPYRHATGVLANVGYRLNDRADLGAEVFWMPADTDQGDIRTTHFDAVAQFRPWRSKGFFLKGGAGMAVVRNWVDAIGPDAINSKALSLMIGGGWAFQTTSRIGLQVFASQHAAALGDLQTADGDIPDVMGNFWAIGAALVFR